MGGKSPGQEVWAVVVSPPPTALTTMFLTVPVLAGYQQSYCNCHGHPPHHHHVVVIVCPMRSGDLLGLAVDLDVGEMRLCSYRQAAASA